MSNNLSELVSKIRYELLTTSTETKYLKNLFRYFNAVYRDVSSENSIEKNPAAGLRNKNELESPGKQSVNKIFEQIYDMLVDDKPIEHNVSADFMLLYGIAFEIRHEMNALNELNKSMFFKKIIDQYNYDFHSNFKSLEDFAPGRKNRSDFETIDFL